MSQFSFAKRWRISIYKRLAKAIVKILWFSCRIQPVQGEQYVNKLIADNQPFIPCFWHQMLIFGGYYMMQLTRRGANIGYLVSPSADGELAAQILQSWGARVIRGSASRTGAQALQALYSAIKKEGVSPVNTPDGPRGPMHHFKEGTVMLAQLSQAPILPIAIAAEKFWRFRSWDQFVLPRPFSRIQIIVGEPVYVARKNTKETLETKRLEAESALNTALQQAQNSFQ